MRLLRATVFRETSLPRPDIRVNPDGVASARLTFFVLFKRQRSEVLIFKRRHKSVFYSVRVEIC